MLKQLASVVVLMLTGLWLGGCSTVQVYQSPVFDFQTAVTAANDSIRPYLLGVNDRAAKANLYDKVAMGKPWGTEDLHAGIPLEEIHVRLQALSTIASYANLLGAVANTKSGEQLAQAAEALCDNVNDLNSTMQELAERRKAAFSRGVSARQAATLDLSGPLSSLLTLFGTLAFEGKQKAAIEAAIINGDKPVRQLIALLKADLRSLTLVDDGSYAAMQIGMLKLYNDARNKTDPKDLIALIDEFVQKDNQIRTMRALRVDSLLSDMENAQAAVVTFAKSGKGPKDLSNLAEQIAVFTAHVKLFSDAVSSVESTVRTSK